MRKIANISLIIFFSLCAGYASAQVSGNEIERPTFNDQSLISLVKVDLYPNPTSEFINVSISKPDTYKGSFDASNIVLHNIIGNTINIKPQVLGQNQFRFNVSELAPGYYLLAIKDPKAKFNKTFKFLKK